MSSRTVHSTQEWDRIKPIFLHLYIEQNKKLNEVRQELADRYGFVASGKAFKGHITRWQAFKNYKAQEKEELAERHDSLRQTGTDTSVVNLRGKPVKWDRVDRHARAKMALQRRQSHDAHQLSIVKRSSSTVGLCALSDPDELSLRAAHNYYHWEMSAWAASPHDLRNLPTYFTYNKLKSALDFLTVHGHAHRGWQLVHQACDDLQTCNGSKTFEILHILLDIINHKKWRKHTKLKRQIFWFISGLVSHKLPTQNPFRHLLRQVADLEGLHRIASRVTLLEHGVLATHANVFPSDVRFELMMDSIYDIIQCGYYSEGRDCLSSLLELPYLSVTWRIKLLRMRAYLNSSAGNLDKAISGSAECISVAKEALDTMGPELISPDMMKDVANVYDTLASSYKEKGDLDSCIAAYRDAFEMSLKTLGEGVSQTVRCFHVWIRTLWVNERLEELQLAMKRFGVVYLNAQGSAVLPV